LIKCPYCGSDKLVKRGFDPYNKQKYKCNNCGRYPTEGTKRHRKKEDIKPNRNDKLKKLLKKGTFTIEELSNETGIIPKEIRRIIKE